MRRQLQVVITLLLGFSSLANAQSFAKVECPSPQRLAEEILRAELQGWRNSAYGEACLKSGDFRYFKVGQGLGYDDREMAHPVLVGSTKDAKILSVKTEESLGTRVRFELTTSEGKVLEDSFLFRVIPKHSRLRALLGCVHILAEPKTNFVLKSCTN